MRNYKIKSFPINIKSKMLSLGFKTNYFDSEFIKGYNIKDHNWGIELQINKNRKTLMIKICGFEYSKFISPSMLEEEITGYKEYMKAMRDDIKKLKTLEVI